MFPQIEKGRQKTYLKMNVCICQQQLPVNERLFSFLNLKVFELIKERIFGLSELIQTI